MTDLGTFLSPTDGRAPRPSGHRLGRTVRRRRTLPGGRAVAGGFLVAVAAIGAFAAHGGGDAGPTDTYVVAARAVSPGDALRPGDLRLVAMDLPAAVRAGAFTDPSALRGAVALGPLRSGELVQASAVARPAGAPRRAQISFAVEAPDALGGGLVPGDLVDVIATFGAGDGAAVRTISSNALVVRLDRSGDAIGRSGRITLVLAVPPHQLEELARAVAAGKITVARTTGVDR